MRPHDLLWLKRPLHTCLPDMPEWTIPHWPVVVRRAMAPSGQTVPVGVRGLARHQRHAGWLDTACVASVVTPETLARQFMRWPAAHHASDTANCPNDTSPLSRGEPPAPEAGSAENARATAPSLLPAGMPRHPAEPVLHLPACIRTLARLAPMMAETGLPWGPTGAVGFWLACGAPVLHAGSDLDLVVHAPRPLPADVIGLLQALPCSAGCRLDIQIETGRGAFALAEWLAGRPRILLKTAAGPLLVTNPWGTPEHAAGTCTAPDTHRMSPDAR